jgi:hypothetical protein
MPWMCVTWPECHAVDVRNLPGMSCRDCVTWLEVDLYVRIWPECHTVVLHI